MNLIQVSILAVAIFSSTCWSSTSPFVLVSTSVSSSSSSSSSTSNVEPMDDSLAVEGRNVKIVRRIRVRTTTTPAPPAVQESYSGSDNDRGSGSGSGFTEAPEILEWFSVKHKEFERVKAEDQATSRPTFNTDSGRPTVVPTSAPARAAPAAGPGSSLVNEAEYVYEYSDTSNGPRVQVIYGDGKSPPPAGLMESPDMMNLIREHLYDTRSAEQSSSESPSETQAPAQPTPSPSPSPQPITILSALSSASPQSPQDELIPPIYHVGGSPITTGSPAPPTAFFSPYHGPSYSPDTETKTYVSSMPPIFTPPTSVTMPAKTVPGVRAMSAWKWPSYVDEQQSSFPFKNFDYNFPSSFPPSSPVESSPNYYPAELPFSPYQEPVYAKPPVVYTKSRPESSPNSIPWTPIPSSSPSFAQFGVPGGAYQKSKAINAINTVPDSQTVAESNNKDVEPGSYSTLGKRMTAPDMRSPAVGEYPDDFPQPQDSQDSVVKGSHYVDNYSTPSTYVSESQPPSSGSPQQYDFSSGPSEDEYSNYIMGSSPSYETSGIPSFSPMPIDIDMYGQGFVPGLPGYGAPDSVPLPKTMYFDHQGPSVSPYNPFLAQPPSLPSFYSPGPSPHPNKHYKIVMVKPPTSAPAEQTNLVGTGPSPGVIKKIHHHVLMVHQAPRAGPAGRRPRPGPPPPRPPPPSSQVYYKYKKRSTRANANA